MRRSVGGLGAWLVAAVLGAGACSAQRPRDPAGAGSDALASRAADEATREPGDPPLILACRNRYFSGTAPVDLAAIDGGLVVASERNEHLYLATVDLEGRVLTARSAGIAEKVRVPRLGDAPVPLTGVDGHVHFTFVKDSRWIDAEVDARGALVGHHFLTAEGVRHGVGQGTRTRASLLALRYRDEGLGAPSSWRQVLDEYRAGSTTRTATIDPNCNVITGVIDTAWGFALTCTLDVERSPDRKSGREHSIVGIVDSKIVWRATLAPDVWWAALGTDGTNLLVVANVAPEPDADDGRPFPVRAIRFDAQGRPIGEPVFGPGRIAAPSQMDDLRLVWTGKEYAAIEWHSITRYDSHGASLGTWRFEPDCARRHRDVKLIWTGTAYAVCGWFVTSWDKNDPYYKRYCQAIEDKVPPYPNRVYDPAEAEPRAPILRP